MPTRRELLKHLSRLFIWLTAISQLGLNKGFIVFAAMKKRILPGNTDPSGLKGENPAYLDTRHLKVMPLDTFDTMGDEDGSFDTETWRLEISGAVQHPVQLSYEAILALPAIEREVLLVCPGVFSNHGRWRGFSMNDIIKTVNPSDTVTKIRVHGHSAVGDRTDTFKIQEAQTEKIFLAHGVNGRPLPRKHGFPLRLVAEGHWGFTWIKYVYKIAFE